MRCGKNSHQFALASQRNRDFRTRIRLARKVVRIARNVGGVMHLASRGDVANHPFANSNAMAFAVNRAAANPCQYEVSVLRVAKEYIYLYTAERRPPLVNNPRNKFVQFQGGGNPLRELLQAHQFGKLLRWGFIGRIGGIEIGEGASGHEEILLPA